MKKFLFLILLLPSLLFAQTTPVTINGNNADSIVSIRNIYTAKGTPILRWRSPIAKYNGSWMWFNAKNFKYDSIATRNDGNVSGKVMWVDGTGVLKFSPKDSLNFNAANGLTKTGSTVKLGGTLNQNTLIEGDYSLSTNTKALHLINKNTGFNTNGSGFDQEVNSVAIQTDQKILVGGAFTTFNGAACANKLVRLNPDGYIDTTFNVDGVGFNGTVYEVKVQTDGKILVGGSFTTYNGTNCPDGLVRLNPNGRTVDLTFNPGGAGFNNIVYAIFVQSDGRILVGGSFTTYNGSNCSDGLVRTSTLGVIDATFNSGGTGFSPALVNDIGIQSDGKIIIAGGFADYNGASCNDNLARLSATGANDATFNVSGTGFNNTSYSLLVLSDDKIIVTGGWTLYNGASITAYVCRINANGSADGTFNTGGAGADQLMTCVIQQPDGKLIVGGNLTTYNGLACTNRLIRINANGTIDNSFNANKTGFSNQVETVGLQLDGKIVVGGGFTQYNGKNCWNRIARLSDLGNIDVQVKAFMDANTGVLTYGSDYNYLFVGDTTIPDLGYIKTLVSDSISAHGGGGGGSVSSVFGRTGAVVADSGDYSISQISGLSIGVADALGADSGNKTINRKFLTQYGDSSAVTNTSWNPIQNTDMYEAEQISLGWGSGSFFYGFGDSFTQGGACSVPNNQIYFSTIVETLGAVLTNANRGVGSTGVFNCFKAVGQAETTLPNKFSATMMIGYNDIRNNFTVAGVNRIENGHRAIIAQHLLNNAVAANSGSVLTTGTWQTLIPNTFNDLSSLKLSGLARISSVAGSTLTYTSTGSNLVIGCWGSDGTTYNDGRFTVTIDGVLKDTWNPANKAVLVTTPTSQDPGRNHNALCYFDLGGGTHTVVITTLDNRPTLVDYFGTLQNASEAPTMLIMGILKGTKYSYQGGTYGSDIIYENANQRIINAINDFRIQGYGIRYVEGNTDEWIPTQVICSDSIHPNRKGYGIIAKNFLGAINRNFLPSQHSVLLVKAKTATNNSGFFASNTNTTLRAIGVLTYPQTYTRSGFVTANSSALQTTSDTLNIGSYSSTNASIGFFAGGFTETDIKARLSSTGIFTVLNATGNTTQIFARNATAAHGSQIFAINDQNKYLSINSYGSANTSAFSQANAPVLLSNDNLYIGSNLATGNLHFFSGGLATSNIRATLLNNGNFGLGITTPTTGRLQISAGSASLAGIQLSNQTIYTGAIVGSISLENINDFSFVGNLTTKRGTTTNIGTSDAQTLQLVTNNINRLSIGTTGIVTLTSDLVGTATQNIFNTITTTGNVLGAATSIVFGATTGTCNIRNSTLQITGGTITGVAVQNLFNTLSTTANVLGAATTLNFAHNSTATLTHNYSTGATLSGSTKTLNFGTGGASGSTTTIGIGSATAGATSNTTINGNLLLSSQPTRNDTLSTILVRDRTTGEIDFRNANTFASNAMTPVTVSGTTLTIDNTYLGRIVRFTSGSAITVTIPQTLSSGFNCVFVQVGAGIITVNTSGTAVINGKTSTTGLYDAISIVENLFSTPSYIGL